MQDFKEKKRTVKKAAVLLVIFLILLLALAAFFKSMALNYPEFVQSRNRPWVNIQSERDDSIDVLVLGDSEIESGRAIIKNMKTKEQTEVSLDQFADTVGTLIQNQIRSL